MLDGSCGEGDVVMCIWVEQVDKIIKTVGLKPAQLNHVLNQSWFPLGKRSIWYVMVISCTPIYITHISIYIIIYMYPYVGRSVP